MYIKFNHCIMCNPLCRKGSKVGKRNFTGVQNRVCDVKTSYICSDNLGYL